VVAELSDLLETGVDVRALSVLIELVEDGHSPEALAAGNLWNSNLNEIAANFFFLVPVVQVFREQTVDSGEGPA